MVRLLTSHFPLPTSHFPLLTSDLPLPTSDFRLPISNFRLEFLCRARLPLKNGEKSPWGQCLNRPVPNGRRRSALWLGRKTEKFCSTNQKSERRRPFGTGLLRHCPQGLFSLFFTFLRAIFSRQFRLSLAPTISPWVSEDALSTAPCENWGKTPQNVFWSTMI